MSQQPAPNPVMEFYNKWSDKTPFFTRTIVIIIVSEFILSFFLPLEDYLGNVTRYTIFSFEIYRIILSPLVGNSLITLILTLMSFPSMGSRLENSMGSASYLSLLGTVSITTNILFSTICLLLYMVGTRSAMYWGCQGFWTILFSLITIECLQVVIVSTLLVFFILKHSFITMFWSQQMPDAPRRLLFIPVDIPSKYMPVAMYVLFSLFGGPQLSYAVAILVGYMQAQGHLDRFRPSSQSLEELECADGSLHGASQSKGYVLAAAVGGHDAWIPINAGEATWASNSTNSSTGGSAGSASAQQHHYQQQAHTVHDSHAGGAQPAQSQHKEMVSLILTSLISVLTNSALYVLLNNPLPL